MKKLFLILVFAVVAMAANAQIGSVKSVTIDTLDNTTPRTSGIIQVSGAYNAITFQALCTQLGGTADGSLVMYGSVDGITYAPLTTADGFIYAYPNDTLTITNGAVMQVSVKNAAFKYYKAVGTGTTNDTTLVTLKYLLK